MPDRLGHRHHGRTGVGFGHEKFGLQEVGEPRPAHQRPGDPDQDGPFAVLRDAEARGADHLRAGRIAHPLQVCAELVPHAAVSRAVDSGHVLAEYHLRPEAFDEPARFLEQAGIPRPFDPACLAHPFAGELRERLARRAHGEQERRSRRPRSAALDQRVQLRHQFVLLAAGVAIGTREHVPVQEVGRFAVERDVRVVAGVAVRRLAARILVDAGDDVPAGVDQAAGGAPGAAEEVHGQEARPVCFPVPIPFVPVLFHRAGPRAFLIRSRPTSVDTRRSSRSRPISSTFLDALLPSRFAFVERIRPARAKVI